MKNKKHARYENPTIIEAVVEIRFSKFLEKSENQELEEVLGSEFRCEKDKLVIYTAMFHPSGLSLQQDKPNQERLVFTHGDQIFAQIYQDKFSFHWVGKYPGWKAYETQFKQFLKLLCKALPGITWQRIGVRFINKLDQKTIEQKVGFWLKPSPNYPENILNAQSDYFYRCKWPLESDKWVQVSIAEAELINKHFKPLIFDIDVSQLTEKSLKLDSSLVELASSLHEEVYNVFECSVSTNYRKILEKSVRSS